MKKTLSNLFSGIIFLLVLCTVLMPSNLFAQSWSTIDGGGTYGISSTTSTNSNFPSIAVFNGATYAIWQEYTGTVYEIHVKKYDGSSWATAGNTAGSSLLYSSTHLYMYPKLVYFNGALYAAWSGFDAGIYVVHVKKFDGSSWAFAQDYTVGEGRSNINNGITANSMKIDICVFNNELYATWVEQDHMGGGFYNVRVSKFNGTSWTSVDGNGDYGINYNATASASYPTLCVFNNTLYAAWTESNSSAVQVRVRRYDGGNTWTFVDGGGINGLNYDANTTPYDVPFSLTSYSGKMYAFWTENNRIRVKRYDATNGWTTDIDGSNGWNQNSTVGAYYPNAITYNNLMYITWEQNPVPRQVRVVSFDGTTKTFIDGNVAGVGINNTTANRGHYPKLIGYKGDLLAVWSEELTSTSGSANQIRAKKYLLPPFVESVSVPANGTYVSGQTLNFTVTFSKVVVVTGGTPYIPITLNTGGTVNAAYTGGSGTNTLTFSYTIVSGNGDTDGISVGTAISNGGATLQSGDTTPLTANLTLNSVGSTTGVLVDAVSPTVTSVSSTTADGYYNLGDMIAITITCSEAATVNGTPALALNSGGTATYVSGSGTTVLTFNYTVSGGQNSVDLDYSSTNALSLSGGTIKDDAGNNAILTLPTVGGVNSLGGQKNIVIDNTAPTVTVSSSATDPTNSSIPVTIIFSEPVTGFVVGDIYVTNGMAESFSSVNAYTYTAIITPTEAGTVTVNIAGTVATDAAGNNNDAATALNRVYDNIAPTVTLSSTATDPTNTSSISVTITFSESVTGFEIGDVATNGTKSNFSGSGTSYTVDITPSTQEVVTVNIAAGVAVDAAGNGNTVASQLSRTFVNLAPIITTQAISDIGSTTATGNGNIIALGAPNPTAHGVCWNTSGTPTTSDNKVDNGVATTTGAFTASITNLSPNTTYYVRAFATNATDTSYGTEVSFKTNLETDLSYSTVNTLSIYPNPTVDGFTINPGEKAGTISIYDITGNLVISQRVYKKTYINISSLQKGIYYVKANGITEKLLKK